jgi:hypothetical protein
MAKLSTAARKALPAKAFAEPDKRKYPIENQAHAKKRAGTGFTLRNSCRKIQGQACCEKEISLDRKERKMIFVKSGTSDSPTLHLKIRSLQPFAIHSLCN